MSCLRFSSHGLLSVCNLSAISVGGGAGRAQGKRQREQPWKSLLSLGRETRCSLFLKVNKCSKTEKHTLLQTPKKSTLLFFCFNKRAADNTTFESDACSRARCETRESATGAVWRGRAHCGDSTSCNLQGGAAALRRPPLPALEAQRAASRFPSVAAPLEGAGV